jgi:hypothetical protein
MGFLLASSDQASRVKAAADPTQDRSQAEQAAAYLDIRRLQRIQRVNAQDERAKVQPDPERHEDAPSGYDDHGRQRDDGEEPGDGLPHIDVAV